MKNVLPPAFVVFVSTVGTAYGCHAFGLPAREIAIATVLAASVSPVVAFGAVLLSRLR